jgi:hypothetical protein
VSFLVALKYLAVMLLCVQGGKKREQQATSAAAAQQQQMQNQQREKAGEPMQSQQLAEVGKNDSGWIADMGPAD